MNLSRSVKAPPVNQAPTVAINSPIDGATFNDPSDITIQATASDSDGTVIQVEFFQNGTSLGIDSTSPYEMIWSGVTGGTYSLTTEAIDNLGSTTTSSAITITVDSPPPIGGGGGGDGGGGCGSVGLDLLLPLGLLLLFRRRLRSRLA